MSPSATIMYFCYGAQPLFDQTAYSILSLMHVCGGMPQDFRVAVFTDRPSAFEALDVTVVETDRAMLDDWLGDSDYIHRRKTCALLDALTRFGGRIIFLDSDTYWLKSPTRLLGRVGPGRSCFHICEGYLLSTGTPSDAALAAQLSEQPYSVAGETMVVGKRTRMWNTGVVGIHAADTMRVREALELSDAIWANADPAGAFGGKIHHAEQFAMGYALRRARLGEASDCVYHYWRAEDKRAFNAHLPMLVRSGLADQSIENLAQIYSRRFRERGGSVLKDKVKMAVRRWALACNIAVRGVRRSVG